MRFIFASKRFSWFISSLIAALIFVVTFIAIFSLGIFFSGNIGGWDGLGFMVLGFAWGILIPFSLCSILGFRLNRDRNAAAIISELLLSWVLMVVFLMLLVLLVAMFSATFGPVTSNP